MPRPALINFLYRFRFLWLLLTVVALWLVTPGVQRAAQVDNSLTVWFLKDDPALKDYHDFQQKFGNDEVVILMVQDKETLLQPANFRKFVQMTAALEKMPEVAQVIGPGNAPVMQANVLGAYTKPLLNANSKPAEVQQALAQMPLIQEQFFTPDFKTSRFLIVLKLLPDFDSRRGEILKKVKSEVHRYFPEKQSLFGGVGIIYAGLNELSEHDFAFFAGLGYLVMFLLILLIYRNFLVLLYALGTVGLATYLTLGIYGLLGFRLNLMTVLLPAILILLGILDVMHIINEKQQLSKAGTNNQETALQAMQQVFRPCLFTSLTNMAGFLALLSSPMAILQNFGIFAALGIFLCFIFTYLLGFLLLPSVSSKQSGWQFSGNYMVMLLEFVLRKKALFSAISLAFLLLGFAGIYLLKSDTYTLGYFPKDHKVVQDHEAMEKAWGAYMPLELLVKPTPGRSLHSPEILKAAIAFSDSAKTISGTGQIFGFHSLYQAGLAAEFGEKNTKILESRSVLNQADKQLKQLYPELTRQFMYEPTQTGRITIFGKMASAKELTSKTDSLLQFGKATFGDNATVIPSGYQPLYANIVQYVTTSQTNSLLLAGLLVFGLIWLFIRNFKLAVLAIIPNLYPIVIMLGIMGWAGINLDVATASIAAIVLSVCVDDTIHYLFHYYSNRKAGMKPPEARRNTTAHVGTAIVLASLVLFCGYFCMIFGSLKTVELFGVLTAIAIASALFSELIIFPILLERFDRDKIKP
jgi:predicted RND superfamily exporter protein